MSEGRPGSAPRSELVCTSQPSPAIPPSSGPCVPGGAVSLLSPCKPGCRNKNSFCHPPEPVWHSWTHGSHGVAEFMGHVWERPEEISDASVYVALVSLTSWFLWIMVSGAHSHSQHLSVWSVMAWAIPARHSVLQSLLCLGTAVPGGSAQSSWVLKMWWGLFVLQWAKWENASVCVSIVIVLIWLGESFLTR